MGFGEYNKGVATVTHNQLTTPHNVVLGLYKTTNAASYLLSMTVGKAVSKALGWEPDDRLTILVGDVGSADAGYIQIIQSESGARIVQAKKTHAVKTAFNLQKYWGSEARFEAEREVCTFMRFGSALRIKAPTWFNEVMNPPVSAS